MAPQWRSILGLGSGSVTREVVQVALVSRRPRIFKLMHFNYFFFFFFFFLCRVLQSN